MHERFQPRACAAVVLYNPDPRHLARLVAGLDGVTLLAFANGPLDAAARASLDAARARIEVSPVNLGLGAGLNAVVAMARAQGFSHVLLLDQDSEPSAALIPALLGRAASTPSAAVIAPRLAPPRGEGYKPIRYAWRGGPSPTGLRAVDFAPTSGSLLNLDAFATIGPFLDAFFIAGLDVEWGFRAWSLGWGSYVADDVVMPHRWGEPAAAGREIPQILRHAPVRNYYYARNVLATARLPHVPWRWRLKSCATLAAQIGVLALQGAPGALRPVRKGLSDALAGRMGAAPSGFVKAGDD